MTIEQLGHIVKKLNDDYVAEVQVRNCLARNVAQGNVDICNLEHKNDVLNSVILLQTKAASVVRDNARKHFEKIVTDALQFVTQSKDYEFIIQETNSKTKTGYEFYVKSTVNGIECIQKPKDANGGGFVDIISVAAKYAYLEVFSDPKIMNNTLFYDEPGKMISEQMSIKFAEYIKFLGKHYNRQTIMITHNENLASVADKTFVVTKNAGGISEVNTLLSLGNITSFMKDVESIYEDKNQ